MLTKCRMNTKTRHLPSLLFCILFLSGCHGATATISGDTPDWTFQTPSQLRERMSDAGQIVNFKTRDQAMARIALDAAGSDVPEVAFMAIQSITEYPARDIP